MSLPSRSPSSPSEASQTLTPTSSISPSWSPPPPNEPPRTAQAGDPTISSSTPNGSSAALYLYTFLATLILLLAVSSAIVIRSLVLRRRHRQMVEEAIRNGTWIQPTNLNRRVDLSKKPKMFEAFIAEDDVSGTSKAKGTGNGYVDWASITPFSLVAADGPAPTPPPPVAPQPRPPPPLFAWLRPSRFLHRQAPITPEQLVTIPTTPTTVPVPEEVHVAVLVAMPSPHYSRQGRGENEHELPPIQVGLVTVPVTRTNDSDEHRKMSTDDMV